MQLFADLAPHCAPSNMLPVLCSPLLLGLARPAWAQTHLDALMHGYYILCGLVATTPSYPSVSACQPALSLGMAIAGKEVEETRHDEVYKMCFPIT